MVRLSRCVLGPLDCLLTCWLACDCGLSLTFCWQRLLLHLLVLSQDLWSSSARIKLCLTLLLRLFTAPLVVWNASVVMLFVFCLCPILALCVAPLEASVFVLPLFGYWCLLLTPWCRLSRCVLGPLDRLLIYWLAFDCVVSPTLCWKRLLLHLLVLSWDFWCSCAWRKLCLTLLLLSCL